MNLGRRRRTTRPRRHEHRRSKETKKLCRAMAFLSNITECYQMLNTRLVRNWPGSSTLWSKQLVAPRPFSGLCKRKLPRYLSCPVKYQYISLAAVYGVVSLLTLEVVFQATEKEAIKPTGEESSKASDILHTMLAFAPCIMYGTNKFFSGWMCVRKRNYFVRSR